MSKVFIPFTIVFILSLTFVSTTFSQSPSIISSPQDPVGIYVTPPGSRTVIPNSFPTLVFNLQNLGEDEYVIDLMPLLPQNWSCISSLSSVMIPAWSSKLVRMTLAIPSDTRADKPYYAGIIMHWDSHSDTSLVALHIKEFHAVRITAFTRESPVLPGSKNKYSFVVSNKGNVTDTILIKASSIPGWKVLPGGQKVVLSPGQRQTLEISVSVPNAASVGQCSWLKLEASSLASYRIGKPVCDESKTVLHVVELFKGVATGTIYKQLPVNIGFTIRRLRRGHFPDVHLSLESGGGLVGSYFANFKVEKQYSSPGAKLPPEFRTQHIKFQFGAKNWYVSLGDVSVGMSALTQTEPYTPLSEFPSIARTGRGLEFGIFRAPYSFKIFSGKKIFTDNKFTSAALKYDLSQKVSLQSSFLDERNFQIFTSGATLKLNDMLMLGSQGGISRVSHLNNYKYDGSCRIYSRLHRKSYTLLSRLNWAGRDYSGPNRGQIGGLISSQWQPYQPMYLWGSFQVYKQNLSDSSPDSSMLTHKMLMRTLIRWPKWPMINASVGFNKSALAGSTVRMFRFINAGISKHIWLLEPFLSGRWTMERTESYTGRCTAGVRGHLRSIRAELKREYLGTKGIPWSYNTSSRIGVSLFNIWTNFGVSRQKQWIASGQGYEPRVTTSFDFAARFRYRIRIIKDLYSELEVANSSYQLGRLQKDWQIMLTIGTGIAPRFHLPLPMIKTKGGVIGEVFHDRNGNNIRDAGEKGLPRVMLFLGDEKTISNMNGEFEFPAMEPGEYPFSFDRSGLPAYLEIKKLVPDQMSIEKGVTKKLLVPVVSVFSIEGIIFHDKNRNGKLDSEEKGMQNIRVIAYDQDLKEREAFSDSDGKYIFHDMLSGTYRIVLDTSWLPRRFVTTGPGEQTVVFDPEQPLMRVDFSVAEKKRKIIYY